MKKAITRKRRESCACSTKRMSGSPRLLKRRHPSLCWPKSYGELCQFDEALRSTAQRGEVSHTMDDCTLTAWHDYAVLLNDIGRHSKRGPQRRIEVLDPKSVDLLDTRRSIAHVFCSSESSTRF
ncbi:hypothetical protein CEXT_708671 [Caerostris extrusa]|uniref:Uncharacterized protein n=1 Tax=Caerostris extrusa TaxID=172846 RepID=A0AAV4VIJ9_CAEEX|nr:hypothetical protein CEXT_708671 [Caerostris extrusa]